jgi:hypothetical protein
VLVARVADIFLDSLRERREHERHGARELKRLSRSRATSKLA